MYACVCICGVLVTTYPKLPSKDGHFAFDLFLPQTPLDGVEAILHGQGNVAAADGGGDCASQNVGLAVEAHSHAVSIQHPQSSITAQLVAVPHLICSRTWGQKSPSM